AAFAGLTARTEKKEFRLGLLLGSRELRFETDGFAVGDHLVVEARRTWGESELGHFACRIERQAELLASGTLSVYQGQMPARDGAATGAALAPFSEGEADRTIDVIVNNAGVIRDQSFPAMTLDDWETVTRTSLDGFFNVTRPLIMPLVRARWGRIINISSLA